MSSSQSKTLDSESESIWKVLAHDARRAILDGLRDGPRTTGEITADFPDVSRWSVMQHLRLMERADVVYRRRDGRNTYYFINPAPIQEIYDRWICRYMQPWTEQLLQIKNRTENSDAETNKREADNG